MVSIDLASLIIRETASTIFDKMLVIADALGLETETWRSGDPTRSWFDSTARRLETYEEQSDNAIRSGFLDLSSGDWLSLKTEYDYNTPRTDATYATCSVTITNGTAADFGAIDVDDLTFSNTSTGATYRNSTGGTLSPSSTLVVTVVAETAGPDGDAGVGDIDAIVDALPGCTCTNTTTAAGNPEEEDSALITRAKLVFAALSPNGPKDAYTYVATSPSLNGGASVTRCRVSADSAVGTVTIYIADADGPAPSGDVALVQTAIEEQAEPLCPTATVVNATGVTQAVTYALYVYDSIGLTEAEIETLVEDALIAGFASRPIGGDEGTIYNAWIVATILAAVSPHGYRCTVSAPAGDLALTSAQVAVLGTVTPTVTIVEAP